MTQPTMFNTDSGVINPGTHIPTIRAFFTAAVAYLGTFLQRNGSLSEEDQRLTKEVMIHLCYVEVLLSKIEKVFGERLTERFDFEGQVGLIMKEFAPYIDGRGMASISLVALMEVNTILEEMIKQVHAPYTAPAGPSLLDRLIMWVNGKLELLHSHREYSEELHENTAEYFHKPLHQKGPPAKWKPKPFEIVETHRANAA